MSRLLPALGIILVLGLIAAGIAVARLSGADRAVAESALDSSLIQAPTTSIDDGTAASDAPTEAAREPGDDVSAPAPDDEPVVRVKKLDRLVDARKAELKDRLKEAEDLARVVRRRKELLTAPFDVRIGSFNVLGSQHTGAGGDRQGFPDDSLRANRTADLINGYGLDIIGLQELQSDQFNTISSRTGLAAYPGYDWGPNDTDNTILYDGDRFEMVSGDRFYVTFGGRPRPQPILRLRVRETGREFYVINTHPAAGASRTGERQRGQDALAGVVSGLRSTGLPVLVTGDMNDREEFYCRVVGPLGLVAANGGGAGCSPPPSPVSVDWVVGTPDITFDGYVRDTRPTDQRTSDHFLIVATAHVG